MKIAFIGLGNMGNPMARNLLKHGHTLTVYDLNPALVSALTEHGATAATSVSTCVKGVDAVVTMLPSSPHVRTVYSGEAGILAHVGAGTLLIDSSTIDPHTARDIAIDARANATPMIDAPVSGGTGGAEAATLTFMVGGELTEFEKAKPILDCMGKNIVHCGGAGNGQVAKICNNLMLAIEMLATAEGMALAVKLGMDANVFASIANTSSGRCWSSDTYNPYPGVVAAAPANREYKGGFGADLMLKDLTLVTEAAKSVKQPLMMGAAAQQLYQLHSTMGNGQLDFSSIIMLYQKQ